MENMETKIMEQQEQENDFVEDYEVNDTDELNEVESGGGLGAVLVIGAGLLTVGGLAVAAIKKHREKKAEQQPSKPKQKTKLKFFVRVPVEDEDDILIDEEPLKYEEANEETSDNNETK